MLCLSMIFRLPEGGPAKTEGHSASNLSLTLTLYPAWMPNGPAKKPGTCSKPAKHSMNAISQSLDGFKCR